MKKLLLTTVVLFLFLNVLARNRVHHSGHSTKALDITNNKFVEKIGTESVLDKFGKSNSAISFDGFNDYLQIDSDVANQLLSKDFTIITRIKPQKNSGTWNEPGGPGSYIGGTLFSASICGEDTKNGRHGYFIFWYDNSSLIVSYSDQKGQPQNVGYVLPEDFFEEYHDIVLTYSFRKKMFLLYTDGDEVGSWNVPNFKIIPPIEAYIGKHNPCVILPDSSAYVESNSHFFKGTIDFMKIYPRALNKKKIREICGYINNKHKNDGCKGKHNKDREENEAEIVDYDAIERSINVYPNPARHHVFIQVSEFLNDSEVRILDQYGRMVYRSKFTRQINLSCFKSGHYTILFVTKEKTFTKRIMVMR